MLKDAGSRGLLVIGGLLVTLIAVAQSLHVPGAPSIGSDRLLVVFVVLGAAAAGLYLGAVALVLHRPMRRPAIFVILAVSAGMRLILVVSPSFLSSDLFRYVWDGRVQEAGINPYRYRPADPALEPMRDQAIYPYIGRADYARTIYPPMAEVIFAAIARINQSPYAVKAAMVGFEVLAIAIMLWLLALARSPREQVLIYAWNPLAAWEFAGNGHVDAAAIGCLALGLLARAYRRDALVGAALAAATLVKFLPVVVFPALWRRWDWRMPVAFVAVSAGLYLPYIGSGWHVLGYLPGYASEEGLASGSGFYFLAGLEELGPLPPHATALYLALATLCLLGVGFWVALSSEALRPSAGELAAVAGRVGLLSAALLVAASPHYPWYFVWLSLPACLAPYWSVIYLSVAPFLLYLDPLHERFLWPSLIYVPFFVLGGFDLRRSKRGARRCREDL